MKEKVTILIAEDDEGHAALIRRNLKRAELSNPMMHFKDGQEALDYLFANGVGDRRAEDNAYLLLLDIRMPKVAKPEPEPGPEPNPQPAPADSSAVPNPETL